jgi:hypothetical protein
VSTNVYETNFNPGEELLNRVAGRVAQKRQEQREAAAGFVERNLPQFEERFGEDAQAFCELSGRFEELRDLAPADLFEEIQEDLEGNADVEKLSERVEMLERKALERYENREICNEGMAEIARQAGGVLENAQWKPGGDLISTFHFRSGNRMKASMSEGSLGDGTSKSIAWYGQTCDTRNCDVQEGLVGEVVENSDSLELGGKPSPNSQGGKTEQPGEREAAGEAG